MCPLDELADRRAVVRLARASGVMVTMGPDGTSIELSAQDPASGAAFLADIAALVRAAPPRATS